MPRRLIWVLLVALALGPVLGGISAGRGASAQDDATPAVTIDETLAATPEVSPEATATVETDPTLEPSETATETPAEEATPSPVATEAPATPEVAPADVSPEASPAATASPTASPSPTPPTGAPGDLTISLRCMATPETIRITNNGKANIDLQAITTLVDARSNEPFALARTLRPGTTALFQAGPTAKYGTVLSKSYILTNLAGDAEGVTFSTSVGAVTKRCAPLPAGTTSDLSIALKCTTHAETVRVTNNGSGWISLRSLGTTYDPISAEPFALDRMLRPGASALFSTGTGATYGTILTKRYIFTNSAYQKDGVRIGTSVGTVSKACPKKPQPPEHWVEVDLSMQYLWAWEGNRVVSETYVSTGRAGFETPTGTFRVLVKYLYDDMAGCIQGECYNVPAVPWTMYFTDYGHALHGAYWHNDFGTPRSHGCINLPLWFAEWLYYWLPYGGRVVIHW